MAQGQESTVADSPDTLPADFFDKKNQDAPDTLPGDFFAKAAPTSHRETVPSGSYQNRKGGPILNANDSSAHAAVRGLEGTLGINKEPTSFGDALGQSASSLGHLGLSVLKDPLNAGKAVEGIATGLEDAGRDVYQGLKHHDPRSVAHGTGAVAGILGPQMEGSKKTGAAVESARNAGPSVGLALRTEKGTLKPTVKAASRFVGAGLGHATSIPGMGEVGGFIMGPSIADALVPDRPFDIPTRGKSVGAPMPLADDFYAKKAADLEARGRQQSALDRAAAKPKLTPFPGTSSAGPSANPELPAPTSKPAEFPIVKSKAQVKAETDKPQGILTPANARPPRSIVERESEGSAARWTNEDVIRLAKQGVRPAIEQARQRGFELPDNVRYVAGDLAYPSTELNPREVTRFTPEGEPIRQGIAPQPSSEIPNVQGRKLYPSPPPKSIAPAPPSLDFERAINVPSEQPLTPAPEPLDRRVNGGKPPEGTAERRGVYDIHKANVGPTEGEKLAQEVRAARAEQPSSITEGEALQRIMRDPAEYEKYKAADQKTRDRMLVSVAREGITSQETPSVSESLGRPITESEIPRSITAPEEEAEPTEMKGITEPVNPKRAAPKEKTFPIEKRFSRDEITDAEGLIAQEVGAMQAADRPGTYFDESEPGDVRTGSRQIRGGDWRAVKSGRNMHPFMKANPQFNPEQLRKALRNKDSAMYQKAIERAVDFIRRSKVSEGVEPEEIESGAEEFPFGANKQ